MGWLLVVSPPSIKLEEFYSASLCWVIVLSLLIQLLLTAVFLLLITFSHFFISLKIVASLHFDNLYFLVAINLTGRSQLFEISTYCRNYTTF